jgi:eukaryotic-like serine/threonine-protein kinase
MSSPSPLDPLGITGRLIENKYLVMEPVGEGGAAIVYRAQHKSWDIPIAIKFFRALSDAPEAQRDQLLAEFIQEGRIMTTLSSRSPVIVQPRDMGAFVTEEGSWLPYMVLEWLDGEPLDGVLVRESSLGLTPRTLEESVALMTPVAMALDIAHTDGIVHRDIKPENMVVLGDPRGTDAFIKLLDFGIAKVMQTSRQYVHTSTAATPFTPHYGAPEQFSRAHGSTGPWTDVFAMALVTLEIMRGGARVFHGDDFMKLSEQSRSEKSRPTPNQLGLLVSAEVDAVFARALAVEPSHRYATMGEFWQTLLSAMGTPASIRASFRASAPSMPPMRSLAAPSTTTVPKETKPARSSIATIATLVALVAGIAGVTFYLRTRSHDAKPGHGAIESGDASGVQVSPSAKSDVSAPVATPVLCPEETILVPGGRFTMGDDDNEPASPSHRVSVDAFCLDRTEVTVAKYAACAKEGKCDGSSVPTDTPERALCNDASRGDHPANCISWQSASAYCTWVHKRLPTEAEWEYAAAGNERRKSPWGKADLPKIEWKGTAVAGGDATRATPLGIFDLGSNVGEWVSDWYAPYTSEELVNPKGAAEGDRRVVRGSTSLVVERRGEKPARVHPRIGFRCATPLAKPRG